MSANDAVPHLPRRSVLWLYVLFFSLIGTFGLFRLYRENPTHWAEVMTQSANSKAENRAADISVALDSVSDRDGPKYGSIVPLAKFVQSNGNVIDVSMIEGTFHPERIEPSKVWANIGRSALLISSVNETRSRNGASSGPIGHGCSIEAAKIHQQLGSAAFIPCKGSYQKGGHIDWVSTLAIIVERPEGAATDPCWAAYGMIPQETGYQACVAKATEKAFEDFVRELKERPDIRMDTLIVPFVGTGAGRLSKAEFLEKFFNSALIPLLTTTRPLPSNIYLQVMRSDGQDMNRWKETRVALASQLPNAIAKWESIEHKSGDSEWLSLTGVSLGNIVLLLLNIFGSSSNMAKPFGRFLTHPSPAVILAWCTITLGSVSIFKAFWTFFPAELNPYLQVIFGCLASIFIGYILNAKDFVESMMRKEISQQPEEIHPLNTPSEG